MASAAILVAMDGTYGGSIAPYVVLSASAAGAPRLRVVIRALTSSSKARIWETALLFMVTCGGGLFWWNPAESVRGFIEARDDGQAIRRPMTWMAHNVPAEGVVLASPSYSGSIAALSGHRVLFSIPEARGHAESLPQPFKRARLLEAVRLGNPPVRLAEEFSVTHLFLGPGDPSPEVGGRNEAPGEARMTLELVYRDEHDFRIFRFLKK